THALKPGFGNALVALPLAQTFQVLRVTAAIWALGNDWLLLHEEPNLGVFEVQHGDAKERDAYNGRLLAQVLRDKEIVRGEHAGYSDLFAPIVVDGQVAAVLVTGPFSIARPTSASVLERWRALTGREGHPADPEFASYLSAAMATLVLDGSRLQKFRSVLDCLTRLVVGGSAPAELGNQAEALRIDLEAVRLVERTWEAVAEMVDERSGRRWHSFRKVASLGRLGLSRVPDVVLVALTVSRSAEMDAVDEAIRRDGFQRAAVELSLRAGEITAGRVGDHGVAFLSSAKGSSSRKLQRLLEFGERAAAVARRDFGLSLHFGTAEASQLPLHRAYQAALAAAEAALVRGVRVVNADASSSGSMVSLWHLRQELGRASEQHPDLLKARFDRYLEAVAAHCGYRMDLVAAHVQVGFERIAEPLLASAVLDEKTFGSMREGLDRAARHARTTQDLLAASRLAVAELSEALQRPVQARHDRSVRGALEYIHEHFTEALTLARVAREA
ncbi:MAG TPA: hypothetical protein VGP93_02170, partial [Polyangiaceae bacterium]|nr:hypothetical protein [Polyangiaceae bacterium]